MKKSLAVLCIIFMSFASVVSAAPIKTEPTNSNPGQQNQNSILRVKKEDPDKKYKDNEEVRVIIEMKEEPAVQYAQKQGKRYKDLKESKKRELKAEKLAGHKKVKNKVSEKKVKFKELKSFTTVVNGFSGEVAYGEIDSLLDISEVKSVKVVNEYQRPQEEPDMVYSKELVQAQEAWRDYGYKGEGMVVGIIDTGIDPTHRDMVLSPGVEQELTKSEISDLKTSNNLPGIFYTEKVPYGYNYMDDNQDILDSAAGASMHGMHVAGTAGANGDEENGGIKGIAPEAQLLALKVFGNDPEMRSTWADIYVKAIDDAIILGADVLNMSLGSTAGFTAPDDPEQQAITRAVNNGIMMSISAGNSAHMGNGFANPLATNPDIGVVGSPGIAYDSLQVASSENNYLDLDSVTYSIDGAKANAPFMSASSIHPNDVTEKNYQIVDGGLGTIEELAKVDLKGKYALIKRGDISFVEKALNAQAAGAEGVFIYNNTDGFISMATEAAIQIPQLFMLKTDGDAIKAALTSGQKVTISFEGKKQKSANPSAGKMSTFTSWGAAPNLDFKPEITAPGGQIYSTLNNNEYGMMSGTSMAAPHVAGGSALILERVENEFKLEDFEKVNLTKNIMMNTASPIIDKGIVNDAFGWDIPYSPRRQGAGIMQLHSALSTPVVVTEAFTNEAKAALKEVGNQFGFTLKAQNYSNKAVQYDVKGNIQTDFVINGHLGYSANELEAQEILDAKITVNGSESGKVNVPANGTVTLEVKVNLAGAKVYGDDLETLEAIDTVFPNGYFVEGFVTLNDPTDTNPELHVPYVGFKGDWDKAPIIDAMKYEDGSYYGMSGAVSTSGEDFMYLGYNPISTKFGKEQIAISPNGDGIQDDILPILSFLRNAKQVEYSIKDSNGKQLRKLRTENSVRKNYYDSGNSSYYSLSEANSWDGNLNNKRAADGQYYYQIKAIIDYEKAEWQTYDIPVKVDTAAPTIEASKKENVLMLHGADNPNGSGLAYYDILVDGKSILTDMLNPSTTEYTLPESIGTKIQVMAVDFAGNTKTTEVSSTELPADKAAPVVHITSPETLSVANKSDVQINGYIEEATGIKEFTLDGLNVPVTYNETKKQYEFSYTKKFKDGVHGLVVKAVDTVGNTASFKRTFLVDSKAPKLTIKGLPKKNVKEKDKNPKVDVTVADNFDEIRLMLNGSEIYYHEFKGAYEMRSFEHTIKKLELELEPGKNTFEFVVTDLAGNQTSKIEEITKESKKKGKK